LTQIGRLEKQTSQDTVGTSHLCQKRTSKLSHRLANVHSPTVSDALQPALTAAMQKHGQLEEQLADFLKASLKLARDLARWQADD
jgi:hypothetical protein